ncbi:hypothetical protein [Azospirillum soli]|uniref:hypothetical protein n=1 Tax=Azospirillum soli TaxID=1304799 RepID=UPI001AE5CAE6|nr:hypothetical protein [Azospirillum soli]MBP2315448.1 hypothetical protein [Azospirillum soli]
MGKVLKDFITCKVKIDKAHRAELEEVLSGVQTGRAYGDVSVPELLGLAKEAEKMLDAYDLPKNKRSGARLRKADGGASANAYKYARPVTRVVIQRGVSDCWCLVRAERDRENPKASAERDLLFTPAIEEEAIRQLRKGFHVYRPEGQEAPAAA